MHKIAIHKKFRNKNHLVVFGHENWILVLNVIIGISMAVKSSILSYSQADELDGKDYSVKYYFELLPRRLYGEKGQQKVYRFADYAPGVFLKIRQMFDIKDEIYLKSIGPEALFGSILKGEFTSLKELTSSGKSGSFFYYTMDGKYTLKTVHKAEFLLLKRILRKYYEYLLGRRESLITKFLGMHEISF